MNASTGFFRDSSEQGTWRKFVGSEFCFSMRREGRMDRYNEAVVISSKCFGIAPKILKILPLCFFTVLCASQESQSHGLKHFSLAKNWLAPILYPPLKSRYTVKCRTIDDVSRWPPKNLADLSQIFCRLCPCSTSTYPAFSMFVIRSSSFSDTNMRCSTIVHELHAWCCL
jgi:hypothetical protein